MKVDDIVRYRGPALVPLPSDEADLGFMLPALNRAGFSYEGLTALYGTPWPTFGELPGYVWRCEHAASALGVLSLLFLLCQEVSRAAAAEVLGAEGVARLIDRDVLKAVGDGRVSAQVDLYPCQGAFVFTDHNVGMVRFSRHVYEPGADSYTCARTTPRRHVARALDLCTGAGLHALLAAAHADQVVGVDINPRALAFAQVNAAMNGVAGRCRFVRGDLYAALASDEAPFDLIVTNPPWIATPDEKMQLYRWGGETGEVLTRQIVEGLPRFLNAGGRLAMFVIYPVMRGDTYLDRLRSWLGGGAGWGISLITFTTMTLESFISSHMAGKWEWADHVREFGKWMDMYDRHQIDAMGTGMVYVTRLPQGPSSPRETGAGEDREAGDPEARDRKGGVVAEAHNGWAEQRVMPLPLADSCAAVERWLDTLERVHAPAWDGSGMRLSDEVAFFGIDPRNGEGAIEFAPGWGAPLRLEPAVAAVIAQVVRGERVEDLDTLRTLAVRSILA